MSECQQQSSNNIAEKTRQARQRLLDLANLATQLDEEGKINDIDMQIPSTMVTDALERFVLWAGNLGAMQEPTKKLSLDYRLSAARDIRDEILRQLDDILGATDELIRIVTGTVQNAEVPFVLDMEQETGNQDVSDEKPLDEVHMILEVIAQSISSLFRIGILIRKIRPRDRFKRALQVSQPAFTDSFDIDYVKEKYPKLRATWLNSRIGSAIAKRRQFITYCRDHTSRLRAETWNNESTCTERLSSKATTFVPQLGPIIPQADEEDAISFVSVSTVADSSSLQLPRLADLTTNNDPFECPICFTLQSFQQEKAWKTHAFRDLKAYVCTLGKSECDDEFFGDRDSWFEHEVRSHRARYTCPLCDRVKEASRADLWRHLTTHGNFSEPQLQTLQDAGRGKLTSLRAQDCPFCDEWASSLRVKDDKDNSNDSVSVEEVIFVSITQFKRHVAKHQEQLAIFALPRGPEEEGTPTSGSIAGSVSNDPFPEIGDRKVEDSVRQEDDTSDESEDESQVSPADQADVLQEDTGILKSDLRDGSMADLHSKLEEKLEVMSIFDTERAPSRTESRSGRTGAMWSPEMQPEGGDIKVDAESKANEEQKGDNIPDSIASKRKCDEDLTESVNQQGSQNVPFCAREDMENNLVGSNKGKVPLTQSWAEHEEKMMAGQTRDKRENRSSPTDHVSAAAWWDPVDAEGGFLEDPELPDTIWRFEWPDLIDGAIDENSTTKTSDTGEDEGKSTMSGPSTTLSSLGLDPDTTVSSSAPKIFQCPNPGCMRSFSRTTELMHHLRMHDMPIKCMADTTCGFRAAYQKDMSRHYMAAHGEYAMRAGIYNAISICEICKKVFTRRDNLMKHMNKFH